MQSNDWHRNNLKFNEVVARFDLNVMTVGFAEDVVSWSMPEFFSDCFYRLYLPLSGTCRIVSTNGETIVSPEHLYLFPPFLPLKYEKITPFTHYYLHFTSEELGNILPAGRIFTVKRQKSASKTKMFERIRQLLATNDPGISCSTGFEVRSLAEQLLVPFVDHHHIEQRCLQFCEHRFSSALAYIESHLHERIDVATLQGGLNMSRSDFSIAFKKDMGVTPGRYIIHRKLSLAKRLLLQTDLRIKEIAGQCGYRDEFYFSRLFKHYFYESPRDFRAKKYT
jgi:AraC-like DNA-binding protein